jgi:hypothetical protein
LPRFANDGHFLYGHLTFFLFPITYVLIKCASSDAVMMGTECITATLSDDSEPSIPPGFGPLAALAFQGIQKDARPADSHPIPVQVLQSVKEHVESLESQPHSAQSRNDTHCSTSGSYTCRQSLRNRPPVDYSRFDVISDDDSDVEVAEKVAPANVLIHSLCPNQLKLTMILMLSIILKSSFGRL